MLKYLFIILFSLFFCTPTIPIVDSSFTNDTTLTVDSSSNVQNKKDQEDTSAISEDDDKNFSLISFLKKINSYSSLLAVFVALIALYLGDLHKRFFKPRLKPIFKNGTHPPYFQNISFDSYGIVPYKDVSFELFQPGINSAIMIKNGGSITAKNVNARIEKIIVTRESKKIFEQSYHPTAIKWSGEPTWNSVDIAPKSYFFLDLLYIKNESQEEIYNHNRKILDNTSITVYESSLKKIIANLNRTEKIFWNVWIDTSFARGLPTQYSYSGDIHIYILVNAENCKPLKLVAKINWSPNNWNKPKINITKINIWNRKKYDG